jgi:hypothetical protein
LKSLANRRIENLIMSAQIPEADWRHFKRLHSELLERFCARVLDEVSAKIRAGDGTARDRYFQAYEILQDRHKELARAFDDFRRSTAVMQLAIMRRMDLLNDQDLAVFSAQTQRELRDIASMWNAR